jgi:hypothetical protein
MVARGDQHVGLPQSKPIEGRLSRRANDAVVDSAGSLVEHCDHRNAVMPRREGRSYKRCGDRIDQDGARAELMCAAKHSCPAEYREWERPFWKGEEDDPRVMRRRRFRHLEVVEVPAAQPAGIAQREEREDEMRVVHVAREVSLDVTFAELCLFGARRQTCAIAAERRRRLPDPDGELFAAGDANRIPEPRMEPTGEDLDRNRLRHWRQDRVEVLAFELADGFSERGFDDVEVADHPPLVEGVPPDDDLDAVIVCVEIALRRREPRNAVLCPQFRRSADFESAVHE